MSLIRSLSVLALVAGLGAGLGACSSDSPGGGTPTGDGGLGGADGAAAGADGGMAGAGGTPGPGDGGVAGQGGQGGQGGAPAVGSVRKSPTNGSAVVVTSNDQVAVAVNRTAGRVSIFKLTLDPSAAVTTKVVDLDVGPKSEPWSAVIGNDDDTAYVILRHDQQVIRIKGLKSTPSIDTVKASTGSEPTGIAISPSGLTLFVANWADGTVTVIDAATLAVKRTVDLNPSLAASGMIGTVSPRAALAHPRSLVVTSNGDAADADEKVYVTEFFSQARASDVPDDDSRFDVGRQGVVYAFDIATYTVAAPITIAPVADTGFPDSKGTKTGCFPNQLYAAAFNNGRIYVTSVCESPRGPTGPDIQFVAPGTATSNFKTQVHAAVFVIDAKEGKELPAQGLLLTREFDKLFTARNLPDDASRRFPLIPNDITFATGSSFAYVTSYGSDAVYRIAYKADGTLEQVGAASQPFIDLKPAGKPAGELPVGIASAHGITTAPYAFVINENSRNLSTLSFATQITLGAVPATEAATGAEVAINRGRKFFVTGLGRWSLGGQGWNSCEACHPDGLTDNVTWFFARGPRQTTSLDGSYDSKDKKRRRVFNWTGIFDEVHDFELNTRGNSGGVGAIVHRAGPPVSAADRIIFDGAPLVADQQATPTPQAGLSGSTTSLMPKGTAAPKSALPDWDEIDEYIKEVRAPRAPVSLVAADVTAGKALFEASGCAGCHGTSQWTISTVFWTPNEENNKADGLLRSTLYTRPAQFPAALNPPSMTDPAGKAPIRFTNADPAVVGANDQINCVLRDVGTFPATGTAGVAPAGVVIKEVRANMITPAQGATGFNIPSLLGMGTGAPYFHAGAARTLEEAFGETFDRHRRAFGENFRPDAAQLRQLVAYVLSIDESTTPHPVPTNLGFSPNLCDQIPPGIIK